MKTVLLNMQKCIKNPCIFLPSYQFTSQENPISGLQCLSPELFFPYLSSISKFPRELGPECRVEGRAYDLRDVFFQVPTLAPKEAPAPRTHWGQEDGWVLLWPPGTIPGVSLIHKLADLFQASQWFQGIFPCRYENKVLTIKSLCSIMY